jgi:nucleotide-binding universal stress UspA family protein
VFPFKSILVPLDGSPLSEEALEPALGLAETYAATLWLLRVTSPSDLFADSIELQQLKFELADKMQREAELYLKSIHERYTNSKLSIKTESVMGSPGDAIIECAAQHNIDLIVMSSHGRSGLSRWVYGSVAEKVLRGTHCATLIIRSNRNTQGA